MPSDPTPVGETGRAESVPEADWARCIFCRIADDRAPATIVRQWADAVALVPLDPVTDGHVIVISRAHVRDATESPHIFGRVMARAAEIAPHPCNIITSAGREATQSVFHLHVHIVPRAENDGLALPWYSGKRKKVSSNG